MQKAGALLTAMIVTMIIVFAGAFAWYKFTGWKSFSYKTGDSPSWVPGGPGGVSHLRFKDAVFTVTRPDGTVRVQDATPALNSMAVAYEGGSVTVPALTLTRPLNPFSFVIPGFNDTATVAHPDAPEWTSATATLTGSWKTI